MYKTLLQRFIMPLMETRNHTDSLHCLCRLEKSQWLSRPEVERIQLDNLRALLKHAYDTVPFYHRRFRKSGFKPENLNDVGQLAKLPKLTKQEIRSNLQDIISLAASRNGLTPFATGGSTGEPLRFMKDKRTTSWAEAATNRNYRWAGLDMGEKYMILWSSPFDLSTSKRLSGIVHSRLMRYKIVLSSDMSEQSMTRLVETIIKKKPRVIKGYASSLILFAAYLKKNGIGGFNLHSIISTAENLPPEGRKLLEEQFNCDVFDTYGSREIALMAGECPEHSGLHVSAETVLLEFAKAGKSVAPGELGEILVTDLQNYGMPLIRYAIGDAGRPSTEECSCGRGLPLMESVDGRVTDFVRASDGRHVPGPTFIYFFSDLPVKKYQIIQNNFDSITVKLVPDADYAAEDDQKITQRIASIVGQKVKIDVEHVSTIPASSRSGKFLPVVSMIQSFDSLSTIHPVDRGVG